MYKLYLVAFIRTNRIETICKITKSKNLAQLSICSEAEKAVSKDMADSLIADFADGELDDNVTIEVTGELNLQMFEFEVNS